MGDLFYIADIRPEFRLNRYITFWRPNFNGYAYPLCWAGKYTVEQIQKEGGYLAKKEGARWIRFPVPCSVVDAAAEAPRPRDIDGGPAPVLVRNAANLALLRRHAVKTFAKRREATNA